MQTFVPLPSFDESAAVLDRQRLGKQRVECLQILRAMTSGGGWSRHPATAMWSGHSAGLVAYGVAICDEWTRRGYRDTCREKLLRFCRPDAGDLPSWWGDDAVHGSHRGNLVRKAPDVYAQLWPDADPAVEYVWPKCGATCCNPR